MIRQRSIAGLLLVVLSCLAVVAAFSQQEGKPAVDTNAYQAVMSGQVSDVFDLEQYFVDQQHTFLPILPPDPDFALVESGDEVLPFSWKTLPAEFENLVAEYENSVPVYPVTIIEDPISRDVVFFNADGKELYSIPAVKGYDPFAYVESAHPDIFLKSSDSKEAEELRSFYDPARIQIRARLIPQEYVEPYLYVQDRLAEEAAKLAASSGGGGMMLMRSGYSDSNINFEVIARTNNGIRTVIGYPNDFTNRLDVFTCNDLMQYVWVFATKGLSTSGTNEIAWVDTNYWITTGPSVRFYSAGNADLDTDHDGYSDASEIMVYRTSETDSNSRPIRISGTVSYSGIETGTIRVLSTTVSDSWSIAQSVTLSGPGVYSNDIGNNQSYWFKAFRDVNSSYSRDTWEPWGIYSVNSTLITSDTPGLNIAMQDQPSLWGAVNYSGAATGNVWVVAVTASDSWNTAYSSMLAWEQGGDPLTGGVRFLTFPASFSIAGIPVSNYWIRAFIDTNYDGSFTDGEIAGQYTSNAIPVSNRITALNFTLNQDSDSDGLPDWWEWQHGTDANNPDTDGDGFTDGAEVNTYGTDPLNKYSVPPLPMLSASGKYIVDTNGNPVVLKSVNLGGWLVFENWLMKFLPSEFLFTNYALQVVNNLDEATMRQMMVQNVDYEVVLVATAADVKVGTTIETCTPKPSVGWFDPGDYIGFSSVNFGTGVSNLTAVVAVDTNYAGKWIDVKLDNASTGALVGSIQVEGTRDWCTPGAQTLEGLTNCTGTHAVYFVGRGASGGIGNLVSFRFYRDTNARQLIETFRDAYVQTNDLDRIKELGYNCVRVPFSYSLIQDESGTNYLAEGWDRLDTLLSECAKRRTWVILDLHSTSGGQNWYEHCGQPDGLRNRLWTNPKCQDRTAHLWNTVAVRYSNNTTVAGYDLFNEPDPSIGTKAQSYSNYIVPLHDRLYKSIRSNDTRHLIFMEDNWHATNNAAFAWNHPRLQDKGWSNVVFELHHYERVLNGTNGNDWTFDAQKGVMDENMRLYAAYMNERQVPLFAGEFCPGDPRNMEYFVRRFDSAQVGWAHWNWRNWGWTYSGDTNRGWDGWGLQYRTAGSYGGVNTNIQPNVRTDSMAWLTEKLSGYNYQNYTDHSQLRKVIQNHAANTNVARERTQFYLNAFNGVDAYSLSAGWSWRKISTVGPRADAFQTIASHAHVVPGYGSLVMRYRTREELDARFQVNDSTGCWFSFEPWTFNVTNVVATNECELRLCVVRDEISSPSCNYNCPGIIARLLYDRSASAANVILYLFSKSGGTNTYGVQLYQSSAIPFVAGEPLRLFVNQNSATVLYGSVSNTVTHTNLALSTWTEGAVCAVEAENNGGVDFVELDNFKAWRPDATSDQSFTAVFTNSPNGMTILSAPERATMPTYWAPSRKSESYVTNGSALLFPEEKGNGSSWISPRRNYQNDVRMNLATAGVVEVRTMWRDFTSGWGKVCLVSELFPGTIYGDYTTNALYVQLERTNANIMITGYRHMGVDGNRQPLQTNVVAYQNGQLISMQVDNSTMQVFYGTNQVINVAHGLVNAYQLYANGAYPHLEIQNYPTVSLNSVLVDSVVCRRLTTFEVPSP